MTTLDRDRATAPVLPEAGSAWPITTTESAKLFARASVVSPGGVQGEGRGATPYPLFMTRAQGSRIWDVDGNEFIDFHSSFGAVLLGHNDPRIKAAVVRAMDEHGVSFSAANPLEVELAERLIGMIPSAERVVFSCTGTEATYHAIRLARGYTGRERILKFEGNYHGWHDYVAWSHHFATDEGGGVPTPTAASAGIPAAVRDLVEVREYNDAAGVRELLAREGDTIAAVIVEPVFHNAGVVLPDPGFLEALREACTAAGSLLIFDEVITGFRHGPGGAQGRYGVTPDLTTMGKALGNGFPISLLAGRAEVMDHLGPKGDVLFAGTFAGQALGCAVALEVSRIVQEGAIHAPPEPARGPPHRGHPGGHRRDRHEGPGPCHRRRLDDLLHRRADPPLPGLRPVRHGQGPSDPARLPELAARTGHLHPPALHDPRLPDRSPQRGGRRPGGRRDRVVPAGVREPARRTTGRLRARTGARGQRAARIGRPEPQPSRRRRYSRLKRWPAMTEAGVSLVPSAWSCSTTSQPR